MSTIAADAPTDKPAPVTRGRGCPDEQPAAGQRLQQVHKVASFHANTATLHVITWCSGDESRAFGRSVVVWLRGRY